MQNIRSAALLIGSFCNKKHPVLGRVLPARETTPLPMGNSVLLIFIQCIYPSYIYYTHAKVAGQPLRNCQAEGCPGGCTLLPCTHTGAAVVRRCNYRKKTF